MDILNWFSNLGNSITNGIDSLFNQLTATAANINEILANVEQLEQDIQMMLNYAEYYVIGSSIIMILLLIITISTNSKLKRAEMKIDHLVKVLLPEENKKDIAKWSNWNE